MSNILFTGFGELYRGIQTPQTPPNQSGDGIIIGHVLDVVVDEKSPYYDGPDSIGTIRVRNIQSQYNIEESSIKSFARPLDRSNYRLPLPGEQVICIYGYGVQILNRYVGSLYYVSVVSTENTIVNNIVPFLGTDPYHINGTPAALVNIDLQSRRFEKKIQHNLDVLREKRSVSKLREGDKVVEGRYGGLVKFTSTIEADKSQTFSKDGSVDGDPLLIIKNTRKTPSSQLTYTDDLPDEDDVSVYLSTSQKIDVTLSCTQRMASWNTSISTGELVTGEDPSIIYQKHIDVTKPIEQTYTEYK